MVRSRNTKSKTRVDLWAVAHGQDGGFRASIALLIHTKCDITFYNDCAYLITAYFMLEPS